MSFPKYPAYKDSGVEWIGEIPVGWKIEKFRYIFFESKEKIETEKDISGDMLSVSGYRGVEIKKYDDENKKRLSYELIGYRIVRKRQLVINTMWLNFSGLGVSWLNGYVSPAYRCYSVNENIIDINYTNYLLRSSVYVLGYSKYLQGIRPNSLQMSREDLMPFPIILPSLPEQQAIASFLDHECGKIDTLIAEQERLIALLAEKRQAVISHAVTKGLNPNAPMKDSGIPWIGMVPEGWEILSLNRVVRDFVDYRGVTPNKVENGIPLITASCIKYGRIDHSIDPVFITEEEYNKRMTRGLPKKGDVILTTEAPLGEVAIVEDELISPGQRMILFKLDENISNFYMRAYYLSDIGRQELRSRASGSTASGIRADRLRASAIPVPPLNEQKEICAYIARNTSAFDSLEQQIRYELELLKERRAALISAVVTGKIDVRAQSKAIAA